MSWLRIAVLLTAVALSFALTRLFLKGRAESIGAYVVAAVLSIALYATAVSFLVWPFEVRQAARRTFTENPLFRAFQRLEPDTGQKLERTFEEWIMRGDKSKVEALDVIADTIMDSVPKYVPSASDASVVEMIRVKLDQWDKWAAQNPESCYQDMMEGRIGDSDVRNVQVATEILVSAAEQPQALPIESEMRPASNVVKKRMSMRYSEKDLAMAIEDQPGADPRKMCAIFRDFYREALALPEPQRGPYLRHIWANRNHR